MVEICMGGVTGVSLTVMRSLGVQHGIANDVLRETLLSSQGVIHYSGHPINSFLRKSLKITHLFSVEIGPVELVRRRQSFRVCNGSSCLAQCSCRKCYAAGQVTRRGR